jgi:hypothetical protein
MDKTQKKLTADEAYDAMIDYLEGYCDRTHSDDVESLLSGMMLLADGKSADSAALEDWNKSVEKVLSRNNHTRPHLKLTK